MYLRNAPVAFVKDGERRLVYHTVAADELIELGWSLEDTDAVASETEAVEAEAGSDPDPEPETEPEPEPQKGIDIVDMTKNQLIEYAAANDIAINPYANKTEILSACLEFQDAQS